MPGLVGLATGVGTGGPEVVARIPAHGFGAFVEDRDRDADNPDGDRLILAQRALDEVSVQRAAVQLCRVVVQGRVPW
jgi:hypothetical protein